MSQADLAYCDYDGTPAIFDRKCARAWTFHDGAWRPANAPNFFTSAVNIGKERFVEVFGELPPLFR